MSQLLRLRLGQSCDNKTAKPISIMRGQSARPMFNNKTASNPNRIRRFQARRADTFLAGGASHRLSMQIHWKPEGLAHSSAPLLCRPFRPFLIRDQLQPVAHATGRGCVSPPGLRTVHDVRGSNRNASAYWPCFARSPKCYWAMQASAT